MLGGYRCYLATYFVYFVLYKICCFVYVKENFLLWNYCRKQHFKGPLPHKG